MWPQASHALVAPLILASALCFRSAAFPCVVELANLDALAVHHEVAIVALLAFVFT
jgi:hypothetical protein